MTKSKFVCQKCGHQSPKWMGKCPSCGEWNTLVEEKVEKKDWVDGEWTSPKLLSEIKIEKEIRIPVGVSEIDRVLGGGLVKGGLYLLGGDPGIGKSTLLLMMSGMCARKGLKILYVSAEESPHQIKLRAERLRIDPERIFILSESNFIGIQSAIKELNPHFLVIDSIQTMYHPGYSSSPGSVSQVREGGSEILKLTKPMDIITFIIGHVTKSGDIAGPKTLEHMVDCVLYLEGEGRENLRILRGVKNRFGPVNEVGIFEMRDKGLVEIDKPSALFINQRKKVPGSCIIPVMEGTRPFLLEIQALVTRTPFSLPRRESTGFDIKRLILILAVLEKRLNIPFYKYDVYVNVTGGIKIQEPAADLGCALSLLSSLKNKYVDDAVVMGEVGLGGEIRPVQNPGIRMLEAKRHGFNRTILPNGSGKEAGLELIYVTNIYEIMGVLK